MRRGAAAFATKNSHDRQHLIVYMSLQPSHMNKSDICKKERASFYILIEPYILHTTIELVELWLIKRGLPCAPTQFQASHLD
jgi:hypothetical protein